MFRFHPMIILVALALSIVVPAFRGVAQTSDPSTQTSSVQQVCVEAPQSFWSSLFEGAVSVGKFLVVTVPVTVVNTTVEVAIATPGVIWGATKDSAEYVYTCVYLFTWYAGTPHPADIFPGSKTPRPPNSSPPR